jgi:hypothetical protein
MMLALQVMSGHTTNVPRCPNTDHSVQHVGLVKAIEELDWATGTGGLCLPVLSAHKIIQEESSLLKTKVKSEVPLVRL